MTDVVRLDISRRNDLSGHPLQFYLLLKDAELNCTVDEPRTVKGVVSMLRQVAADIEAAENRRVPLRGTSGG